MDTSSSAIVLCGGRSSRMRRDKASLPFGGETLLERTARVLESVVRDVVIVAREGQALSTSRRVIRDPEEGLGPLAGLAVGLRAMRGDRAFVAACDMPFLRPSVVERMLALSRGYQATVLTLDGFAMSMGGVYTVDLAATAEALLAEGKRRALDLIERADTRIIQANELADIDPDLESFRNCNTREEYLTALRDAGFDSQAEHARLGTEPG